MRVLILALICSVDLWAQGSSQPWQEFPSQGQAPKAQYRLTQEGQALKLEIKAAKVDQKRWALHFWLGDPRVVEARQHHLADIRKAINDAEQLLKDPSHQHDSCQASLHAFLGKAFMARAQFRRFDPYSHLHLVFQEPKHWPNDGQIRLQLKAGQTGADGEVYTTTIPFKGGFPVLTGALDRLSVGLSFEEPAKGLFSPGLHNPVLLPLKGAWGLEPLLAPWIPRLRLLLRALDEEEIYLPDPQGYVLGRLGQVDEVACYGAEGRFRAPDVWSPWPRDTEAGVRTSSLRLTFSYVKGNASRLAVQSQGHRDPDLVDLSKQLNSLGEQGMELLDSKETEESTFLLLEVNGESVPGGGGGMCGAGSESNLLWLQFDASGRLVKAQSYLTVSCFTSIEAQFHKDNEDGVWTWEWDVYSTNESHTVSYDPRHPELGLSEEIEANQGD
ncbi:MAG TPA: hypothetical protein VJ600_02000 [Holophagaceae bacterium]|nr:hypothetical protein [Holophagaceae bacterium]